MAKVTKEITEFRDWFKKTYGIQDYEAYRDSQTEEICIQYASLKEQEARRQAIDESIQWYVKNSPSPDPAKIEELEKLKK